MEKISIVAYARSGNTFLYHMLSRFVEKNKLSEKIKIVPYTHDYNEFYNDNQKNIFIVRNPVDCISSYLYMSIDEKFKNNKDYLFKNIDSLIKFEIDGYRQFIKIFLETKNAKLILFDDLISKDINKIILEIFKYCNVDTDLFFDPIINFDKKYMMEQNKNDLNNNKYLMNYPRDIKSDLDYIKIKKSIELFEETNLALNDYNFLVNKWSC